ncbi:MAG: hypothetical protein QXK74_01830 [Candidatus Nitrosocaldaceae archaeon]
MSYRDRARFYSGPWLIPKNLLEFNILPKIKGIYRFDEEPLVDAFFLSHAHIDRYKYDHF